MKEEHYHCLICEEPYFTKEEAEQCFKNHNEIETLRWVALEASYLMSYAWELNHHIEEIVERFNLEDDLFKEDE